MTLTLIAIAIGLIIAVILMFRGLNGAFAMTAAALIATLIGGTAPADAAGITFKGVQAMVPIIMRVLAAGVLVGSLVYTGAAVRIAESIIESFGESHLYAALALAAFALTAVGIFPDVVLVAVSPIALEAAHRLKKPSFSVILALSGGVKAGNIASPNPLVLAAAEGYQVPLSTLILANYIPALLTLGFTIFLCNLFKNNRSAGIAPKGSWESSKNLPSFWASVFGPLTAVGLILLRPLIGISIDPLYAMPIGGIAGIIALRQTKEIIPCLNAGIQKVSGVVLLLIGIGAFSGLIAHSNLSEFVKPLIDNSAFPLTVLTPLLTVILVTMTGSATASATITASIVAPLTGGQNLLALAALTCAGALLFEGALHCSFLHITKESMGMTLRQRLRVLPFEALIAFMQILFVYGVMQVLGIFFKIV